MIRIFALPHSDLAPFDLKKLYFYLNFKERKEILSYRFEKKQRQKLSSLFLTKYSLAKILGIDPREVVIKRDENGRPFLINNIKTPLDFNMSHSGKWTVLAANTTGRVGIDVESICDLDIRSVVVDNFHPHEVDYIFSNNKKSLRRFYRIWTLKEAYLKALGVGLTGDFSLDDLCFRIDNNGNIILKQQKADREQEKWKFGFVDIDDSYQLSFCLSGEERRPKVNFLNSEDI